MARYDNERHRLADASRDAERAIADLKDQQKAKLEAFVAATSPILRAALEKQIEDSSKPSSRKWLSARTRST